MEWYVRIRSLHLVMYLAPIRSMQWGMFHAPIIWLQ